MADAKAKIKEEAGGDPAQSPFTATAAQIADWKAKFGELFSIEVEDDRGSEVVKYRVYLKRPERKILMAASQHGGNPMKFAEVIFTNCFLAGDEIVKTDDYLRLAAESQIGEVIKVAEAKIVKL